MGSYSIASAISICRISPLIRFVKPSYSTDFSFITCNSTRRPKVYAFLESHCQESFILFGLCVLFIYNHLGLFDFVEI